MAKTWIASNFKLYLLQRYYLITNMQNQKITEPTGA